MKIKGLIFDFDGVIIDTEYIKYKVWSEIFNSYGATLTFTFLETLVGHKEGPLSVFENLEQQISRKIDRQKVQIASRDRFNELLDSAELMPGVLQYLNDARTLGMKMVIASNAKRTQISPLIDKFRIRYFFEKIFTIEDVRSGKPDPEMISLSLTNLGLGCDEIVAFDDTNVGLKAARAAGVFCIGVQNFVTKHFDLNEADFILSSMEITPFTSLIEKIYNMVPGP